MEKGERRVQAAELIQLAALYGRSVGEFLRAGEPAEAFGVQLRALASVGDAGKDTLGSARDEFQRLCEDYLELERLCDAPAPRRYPMPYEIGRVAPELAAEDVAVAERNRLGLGDGPVLNLRGVLESDVGLRVFYLALPRGVAEMFAYTEQLGGCIAVNSKEPEERRRMSVAHGYGHFLTNRYQPEVCVSGVHRSSTHERFAGGFASAFLMPAAGLSRRFHDLAARRGAVATVADLLTLAHQYFVSAEAMARRLEDLRLVRSGTWDHLRQQGFRVHEARQILGLVPHQASTDALPARYQFLAIQAFMQESISEGQLARFLRTDRVSARRLVQQLTSVAEVAPDGVAATIEIDLSAPLRPGDE
jgi:Zn-dependent peptidase ImmA (M78 family)